MIKQWEERQSPGPTDTQQGHVVRKQAKRGANTTWQGGSMGVALRGVRYGAHRMDFPNLQRDVRIKMCFVTRVPLCTKK